RAVLQLLADFTGMNVVVSDTVTGSLTLRLKSVPWDQALDIILKTKGLAMRKNGNVVLVAPSEEIAAREKLELEALRQLDELAPLRTEWFQINYANAKDLVTLFKGSEKTLLSTRGKVVVDERTNTLMIQDVATNLDEIRKLISHLDIPVRQVLIESRIVIANDDFAKDLGVKFGLGKRTAYNTNDSSGGGTLTIGGTAEDDLATTTPIGFDTGGLIVDFGAVPSGGNAAKIAMSVGRIGAHLLDLELSALQAEGNGEIISSPRVITANQKTATIKQGVEIPYQEASSSGATTVSFKEAVLSLEVTPQITPDNRIIMDLKINKDSPDFTRSVGGVPPVDTREIITQVLVKNGDTVVLGGVYEQERTHRSNKVPFFGDLPLLGFLFRDKADLDNKSELLIFVTPKILKDEMNAGL
ncbi:MAG: type IV pilus secretin PilQ family protein, partial [Gammaproteobacteria bacterium]|nr:type IV pilus secretin PilQ family protein [Gammaproteobacteria bacterium]